MGHRCDFYGKIENIDGKAILCVDAEWKNKRLDVMKYDFETAITLVRPNLCFSRLTGYIVTFEGEKLKNHYYYGDYIAKTYPYEIVYTAYNLYIQYKQPIEEMKQVIAECYPKYKYICKKYQGDNVMELFALCKFSNEHKETEILTSLGFNKLALNKSFYKLSKAKQSEIKEILKELKGYDFSLSDIRLYKKSGATPEEFEYYKLNCYQKKLVSFQDYQYLKTKSEEEKRLWYDLRAMLSAEKENDPYWRHPKDIRKIHNKLLEEKKKLEEAKNKEKFDKLKQVTKRMNKEEIIKGYKVYVGKEYKDWYKHATELNQCILRSGYYNKVIRLEEVLIFIDEAKTNKPVATAEIYKNGQLGQFYGNEYDRNNCKPSEEIKEILMQYLNGFKVKFARA